jgi:hypothetical protein
LFQVSFDDDKIIAPLPFGLCPAASNFRGESLKATNGIWTGAALLGVSLSLRRQPSLCVLIISDALPRKMTPKPSPSSSKFAKTTLCGKNALAARKVNTKTHGVCCFAAFHLTSHLERRQMCFVAECCAAEML